MVAPSWGFGFWSRPEGVEVVGRFLDYIQADPRFDSEHLVLAGVSNGGLGVTRSSAAWPDAFMGRIYLSAVLDRGEAEWMRSQAPPLPTLIVHGEADRRISVMHTRAAARALEEGGSEVSLSLYEGEDHFLLFSQRHEVMDEVGAWLDRRRHDL